MIHKLILKVNITLLLIMFMVDVEFVWGHIIVLRIVEVLNRNVLTS